MPTVLFLNTIYTTDNNKKVNFQTPLFHHKHVRGKSKMTLLYKRVLFAFKSTEQTTVQELASVNNL